MRCGRRTAFGGCRHPGARDLTPYDQSGQGEQLAGLSQGPPQWRGPGVPRRVSSAVPSGPRARGCACGPGRDRTTPTGRQPPRGWGAGPLQGLGSLPSPKRHARSSPWGSEVDLECLPDLRPLWAACWRARSSHVALDNPRAPGSPVPPGPSARLEGEGSGQGTGREDRTRLKKRSSCSGRKLRRAKASSMLHRCGRVMLWPLLRVCWRQMGRVRPAGGRRPDTPLQAATPRAAPIRLCGQPSAGRRGPDCCLLATQTAGPCSQDL